MYTTNFFDDNLHVAYNNKAVLVYAGVYCIVLFNTLYIPVHGAFDEKTAHISDSSITCILFPSSDVYQGGKDTGSESGIWHYMGSGNAYNWQLVKKIWQ